MSGDIAFSETFTNHQFVGDSYPGEPDECFGSCVGLGLSSDTHVYRGLDPTGFFDGFLIAHTDDTFTVTFGGPTSQTDEQWSIDNVRVTIDAEVEAGAGFAVFDGAGNGELVQAVEAA